MSILEYLGELFNPGPVGTMDFNDEDYDEQVKFITLRFVIALILIGIFEYFSIFRTGHESDYGFILKVNGLFIFYLFVSFFSNIKPDYENLGWVPFLVNNPFRISDNINRFLVLLKGLMMPGKYISKSIVAFYINMKNKP